MTKRELIRLAGISVTTVRNMEKGNNVNLDILRKTCEALHVNLGDVAEFADSGFGHTDDYHSYPGFLDKAKPKTGANAPENGMTGALSRPVIYPYSL